MRGSRFRIVFTGLALWVSLAGCGEQPDSVSQTGPGPADLPVAEARLEKREVFHEAVGTVRARTTSPLSAKIPARIVEVAVREGERVDPGQVLVTLDERELAATARQAEATLAEAEASGRELERAIAAGKAAVAASEAQEKLAVASHARYQTLLAAQSVSRQEFDRAEAVRETAVAETQRAKASLAALVARQEQLEARRDQARAGLDAARLQLGHARIASPATGVVVSRTAEPGQMAMPGQSLLVVEEEGDFRFEAQVEESRLAAVRPGDPIRVRLDVLPNQEFVGAVAEIVPVTDPASRTGIVKIDLPDPSGHPYRSGFFGRAFIPVGHHPVLMVPVSVVTRQGALTGIWVLDGENRARLRLVSLGREEGGMVEVLAGLGEGERYVSANPGAVRDGLTIGR